MATTRLVLRPRSQLKLYPGGEELSVQSTVGTPILPLPLSLSPLGNELIVTSGGPTLSSVGSPSGLTPNLPAGMTLIGERFWDQRNAVSSPGNANEGKWYDDTGHTYPNIVSIADSTLVSDLVSGQVAQLYKGSAGNVGRVVFTGSGNSTSPSLSTNQNATAGAGYSGTELYISMLFAVSLNWYALTNFKLVLLSTHTPGTNANSRNGITFHLRTASGSAFGDATTAIATDIEVGVNSSGGTTSAIATQQVTRGMATLFECYIKLNTNGSTDGICQQWINGTLAMNRTNIGYRGGSATILGSDVFYSSQLYNSKGGPATATVLPAAQRLYHGYTGLWIR